MAERIALVFSGIGTQWAGMAQALLASQPAFRQAVLEVEAELAPVQGWSLLALLEGRDAGVARDRPDAVHPAIFSVQYGLTRWLQQQGLQPAAVIGHSGGEVAAAVAAGVLSLHDAAQVVAAQCELMRALQPGAMLHVAADPAMLAPRLSGPVELAAVNAGQAVVVSGQPEAVAELAAALGAEGIETRSLGIGIPFHTQQVEPHLERFRAALAALRPQPASVTIHSSLRGGPAQAADFDADYWARHIRQPVQFAAAARALLAGGVDGCVEVAPHPVLLQHLAALAAESGVTVALEATLQRGQGQPAWPPRPQAAAAPLPPQQLEAALQEALEEALEAPCALDAVQDLPWGEIGCSSLQIVRLMGRLSQRIGRPLSVTLPYRHPTPRSLLDALAGTAEQAPAPARTAGADARPQVAPAHAGAADEPVAIIGMGCRFPGRADHPQALWDLLVTGEDPVCDIPPERWPADAWYDADRATPGRSVSRWGGFIASQDLRDFDARHFRMTPREASALDPQQRLLLEVSWEALENAGLRPAQLKGRRVGVYIGVSTDDYKNATLYHDITTLDPYAGAGAMDCTAAGRLSFFFGWEGPSLALDTACSSSLVALHVACQALRAGECDYAVVGGVNALLTPHLYVYFSKAGILSPTGRCHVFDEAADGYVRAEGCGMLVLQLASAAAREHRRVRARVIATAVNQDGASTSFSTPSGAAQRRLLLEAWQRAGLGGGELGYIEAHGTGTAIGDPIELEALAEALGTQRSPEDPLLVGSVKSNLGHLESAAGVAALAKTVLALEHAQLPANLHLRQPNTRVDWARSPLRVVDRPQPWPQRGGRRIGGISSFGFSGTNAHAVLEQAAPAAATAQPRPVQVLALGAPDRESLRGLARRYAERAGAGDAAQLADLACTTHLTRGGFGERVAAAGTPAAIASALAHWAEAPADGEALFGGSGDAGPLVFAFTGQGCQYPGMAAALYRSEPVFREVLDRCEAALQAARGEGMLALLLDADADAKRLERTDLAQPAIYAVQCGLVALLASWGITPGRVVGHSVGEFAAAVAAGVLELEDGLALVARRGELMAAMPAGGAMAGVTVDEATARAALGSESDRVAIAAVNGARSLVLSGEEAALAQVLARLGPAGARARRLAVSHAYHSPQMAPAAEAFAQVAAPAFAPARLPWISSVDGTLLSQHAPGMDYWARQLRLPVRFHDALTALEQEGCRTFVEIGPAAVLTLLGRDRAEAASRRWIPVQQRGADGNETIARALAALAASGAAIDWAAWDDPAGRRLVDLPPYPFQRRRHWREPALPAVAPASSSQSPYEWLNRYALARLRSVLGTVAEVVPRWQRHHASCVALLSGAAARSLPAEQQLAQERAAFLAAHPTLAGSLELLEDCLAHYPAVFAGRVDPLTLLFPGGRMDRVEAVYAHNEVQDRYNAQLAAVAARICADRLAAAPGQPLRIVEIGAGTGAATASVLAALPAGASLDYLFTDIGPAFLGRARKRFPQVRCAPLDIERHPGEQGFQPAAADLLIADNVLHATADVPQALAHVRWLCAPGAVLLLNEQTQLQPFIHLVFGLTEGWWRFADALRAQASSPVLSRQAWVGALQQAGFQVDEGKAGADAGQAVFVAQATKESSMAEATVAGTPAASGAAAAAQVHAVRAIVCELTGLSDAEVGADASLLDLGLDSLMLVQLKALLAARCGLEVEMADFYDSLDTVARLAAAAPAAAEPATASAAGSASGLAASPGSGFVPLPQSASLAAAAPQGEVARLLALQLETMSRLLSEQNALLATAQTVPAPPLGVTPDEARGVTQVLAAQAAPAPTAAAPTHPAQPPARARSSTPNFRSLKLDADALDARQQAFVADLAARYAARTPSSKALADRSRHTLADWKNTLSFRYSLKEMMYPIVAASSQGARFTDPDGNEFLDLTMGCGIALLGHSPAEVTQALHAQVDAGFAIGPQTALAAEVAERIARLTGMERVTFCNTGAEAVMMAVRLARAKTGRSKLVIFSGAYHGTWDGVLGVEHEGEVHPIAAGIPPGMVEDLVVLNYGTEEALASLRAQAAEVAAVLVEPVQSRRPGFHPVEFLRQLRAITSEAGAALIFDEMITGFRIQPGGCQAEFGIRADLATYGKIVGGGMPMSVVAGNAQFMDPVDGGDWRFGDGSKPATDVIYFGGTYVKHPLALAAARAALDHIEVLGAAGYEALNRRAARMADTLNAWFAAEGVPLTLAHFGSLFRLEGTGRYSAIMQPVELDLLFLLLNLRGLYVWERRVCFLSFAHTDADVDHVVRCVQDAVRELRQGGFAFAAAGAPVTAAAATAPASARSGGSAGSATSAVPAGPTETAGYAASATSAARAAAPRSGPASSAQRRMFALAGIEGPSVVYNVPLAVHLRGPLDVPRLEQAIAQLVARHSALRTRFEVTDDALLQRVEPEVPVLLERDTCSEDELTQRLNAFVRPFDLASAPLLRAGLLEIAPQHHVLVLDAHHIVVDGLTLNIIARELMAAYDGQPLPAPAPDMVEAARAEQAWLASEACQREAAWWREQFRSLPEPLQLPLDLPRPLHRRHCGADLLARLDAAATTRLKAAARAHRMPLFPLLLSLYATLLHRLCAQDDLVIGLPVGGRADPRFRDTVGMLAATLPLRLRAQPGLDLADAARACHQAFLGALSHQAYPLDALIASLDLPRDTARNPLFDTMFIYEDGNDRVYRMRGLECAPAEVSRQAAMFDLTLEVVEAQGELTLRCEYDTDLLLPASAQAILDTYLRLLQEAPDRMELPVAQLELLAAARRAEVLAWGDGGAAAAPCTVLDLFDAQLRRAPDATALVAGGRSLSYRALDQQANRLAHTLLAGGALAPDTPVALLARRDAGLLTGMLAVLRAGAAYLPLDPSHPLDRARLMLEASGCRHMLVAAELVARVPPVPGLQMLRLDAADPLAPAQPPAAPVTPEQLANILFTSGSTGVPKGVMVRHRNLAALFAALPASLGLAAGGRMLAITTPSFDIAGLELLGALCCGMTVVLASEQDAEDAALLAALAEREQVDVAQVTPSRLRLLAAEGGLPAWVRQLRTLLVGGEALPQDLATALAALPATAVFNVYGPTETTIWSARWRVAAGPVRLGRPFPGERLLVLSPGRRLQPPGAIGEIAIGGAGVARGYIGDAARSAERFVEVPGVEGPVYLTGDLGRWHADGALEYLGRRDEQVKLRGMRIEIGEIEHQLRRLPGVQDAAAAVRANRLGEDEIVAWLAGPAGEPDAAALRSALASWLPAPMIPSRFIHVAQLPRTANGKTDRRALPEPKPEAAAAPGRAPEGPVETAIAAAFGDVLGRTVAADDDFFLCGGESIRALRLASRIRAIGLGFELRDLFQWPTPARLAANLRPLQEQPAAQPEPVGRFSGLASDELEDLLA